MAQKLAQLKQQLAQIKNSPTDAIDENFYSFMVKAKDSLGETSYFMAQFYFQYAHFILQRQEANLDLFNQTPLPDTQQQQDQQQQQQGIPQGQQEGHQQQENQAQDAPKLQLQEQSIKDNEASKNNAQAQVVESQKQEKKPEADQQQNSQTYEDKEICAMNLELAINLFEEELVKIKNGNSDNNIDEVLNGLRRARTRLGDFYLIDENYAKSVEQYQKVIESQSSRQGFECNRLISELYYLIGNSYLYENQQNCQIKAISEYIKAIKILLNHLKITLTYETSDFDIPTEEKRKVNRTHYMAAPGDSNSVIQIKNVISCLLDKIEHADNQISMRKSYEAQKQSKKEGNESKKFQFKNQSQIMSFGSLSNLVRKRMPQQEEITELPFKESGIVNNIPPFQKKQQQEKPQE